MNFTRNIKKLFSSFGYEILSKNNPDVLRKDPFNIKGTLLREVSHPVIVDIGAYIGDITESYRKLFPSSSIYCFEPYEKTYSILKNRFQNDSKIHTINAALSDKSETARFFVNENFRTNSLLSLDAETEKSWPASNLRHCEETQVRTYSFDDFSLGGSIDLVHLFKIDAQGSELQILKGALQALKLRKIKIIYLEVLLKPTYQEQAKFPDILHYLADLNYSLYGIYNHSYSTDGSLRQVDVLFTENGFLENLSSP